MRVGFLVALLALSTTPALAQQRPRPAVEIAAGALYFADDGVIREGFLGVAARGHLSPRVSLGPEVAFISGEGHSHFMLTGNLTLNLLGPVNGRPRPVTPFLVAGGGFFFTRERFINDVHTSFDGAFTAGGGVRARLTDRLAAGVEARLGWELHLRLNALVTVAFD